MKPISPTRSLRPWATVLLTAVSLAWIPGAQAQGNRPPMYRSPGPAPRGYAPQPQYAPRPQNNAPRQQFLAPRGYAQGQQPRAFAQPQQNYTRPQNTAPQGYGSPTARYGYQQSPRYNQPSGYGQNTPYNQPNRYAPGPSAYGQNGGGYPNAGGNPQSVPNRNANYTGMQQDPVRQNPQQRFWQQQAGTGQNGARGEHLQQWMQQHNSLNTQDQQRALEREPGFNQLPQQTQQRMLNRLQRLNSMPPQQRERVLQRSEQMEQLSPAQRGQVRGAMGQLGALPQDRRRAVARSFRELRSMSPEQRSQMLNSPEYRQQFNDQERNTLNNLLTVSPMLPQQ